MTANVREQYLESEVTTATPQKLQLMLLDAAIRACQRAKQLWQVHKVVEASESIGKAREIVAHLLGGLRRDQAPQLVAGVAALYAYVLRTLVEASAMRDQQKVEAVIRVLEIERETWSQVCQELGETFVPVAHHGGAPMPAMHVPSSLALDLPTGGFSIDA